MSAAHSMLGRVVPLPLPRRRPRVLHVVVAGEVGGAERMLVELASRPQATSADHVVALMTPNDKLARLFKDAGLHVHDRGRVRENPIAYVWRSLGPADTEWLAEVMARERATVAQLHTFGSQVVGTRAARRMGLRVVRTEHAADVYKDLSCWPFSRWSLQRADAVVAVSDHVRRVALAKAPWVADRIRVIHNGVDTQRFAPRPVPPPGHPFSFALVGRLEHCKGIDLALDALAMVPDAELHVAGEGRLREKLEAHARRAGVSARAHFHGYMSDPRELVSTAQAAICSSRQEGLGIALLESMALGRPVVAFPVGGVPEIVRDGETGWVAGDKTPQALARSMREAMRDRRRLLELGTGARNFVARACSIEQMCGAYADVYRQLMDS